MNKNETAYLNLLENTLQNGVKKSIFGHKKAKYLLSTFGHTLKFDCSDGKIPVYTTKKVAYKNSWREMLWFLEGSRDVVKLHKQGCKIWDDWGLEYTDNVKQKDYTENEWKALLKDWGTRVDNGVIKSCVVPLHYSNMTNWGYFNSFGDSDTLDQTKWVIDNIQRTPDRKSFVVNSWNPTQVYQMADECGVESVSLPACHFYHQLLVNDEKLHLIVGIRSNDALLGNPFNISQYGLLLHMYAKCTGFESGELVVQIGDFHIYSNHIEQVKEQLTRIPYDPPTLKIKDRGQKYLQDFVMDDFELIDYKYHPPLKADITVVGGY